MTWKKRQEHVMDEDIAEPSEWRINQNEFASEFNGFLDNDNLYEQELYSKHVKRDTFTKVLINQKQGMYSYLFTHEQSGWTNQADFLVREDLDTVWDGILAKRGEIILESWGSAIRDDFDGWVTEETGGPIGPESPLYVEGGQSTDNYTTQLPFHDFTTETDALIIVDFHGTVSWQPGVGGMSSPDLVFNDHWDSAIAPPTGYYPSDIKRHITPNGASFHRPDNYYYKYRASSTLCSMWRVVVDGMIVAETGMLGCEYQHHPIYLTGAIPVSSGNHRVELQAQFVWYSPGLDKVLQSSGFNPTYASSAGAVEYVSYIRTDCELRWPNLIAQIRSR